MENKDLAYYLMILFVIFACGFVIYYISSNASQCLADPLKFYSDKIGTQCYCFDVTP